MEITDRKGKYKKGLEITGNDRKEQGSTVKARRTGKCGKVQKKLGKYRKREKATR